MLGELLDPAFAITFFAVFLALAGVFLPLIENRIDEAGELMGCGADGLGLVQARAHAPEGCAKFGLTHS